MDNISPELVERMVNHLRHTHRRWPNAPGAEGDELRAIVALLPPPVDPDLIEARKAVATEYSADTATAILAGGWDRGTNMAIALRAIKRGRELAGGAA